MKTIYLKLGHLKKMALCCWLRKPHGEVWLTSCRTADFIFEKKGNIGLNDLKTVEGKGSVGTQLLDSIGQTNRVILNMTTNYNARLLSSEIKAYFEANEQAIEVLIFKGKKSISISRWQVEAPRFNRLFRKKYEK